MKSSIVLLFAVGLVSALSIPPTPVQPRGLVIRQAAGNGTEPVPSEGAEAAAPGEEENAGEEGAVEEGQEEEGREGENRDREGEDRGRESDDQIADDVANGRNRGRYGRQRQQVAIINATRNLINLMGLNGLFNLNGIANLGINQQIGLFTQLQQLAQLQQVGLVNRFQLVSLIQQGQLLNNFNLAFA